MACWDAEGQGIHGAKIAQTAYRAAAKKTVAEKTRFSRRRAQRA